MNTVKITNFSDLKMCLWSEYLEIGAFDGYGVFPQWDSSAAAKSFFSTAQAESMLNRSLNGEQI